ncbi:TolC family protein [Urbifossiella limnaea]|uniref:Outer membrane efflux protein n=1 Tax=Urbifossiella limnaea TaxID=2528023 RepID=A0A517XXZ8_9BACT|nr:TolC family protein [Urbifossiella limnaea]QDU22373.1 Outer membrane efflux protein [Urbifossiella limnaea]
MQQTDLAPFARRARTLGLALLLIAVGVGCNRQHYRQRADHDVEGIISQKNVFPDWQVKNFHAYPNPAARFADPSDPDHPPYPPDDYAARVLSPNPQHPTKRAGAGRFEGKGYLDYLGAWDATNRGAEPAKEQLPPPNMDEVVPNVVRTHPSPDVVRLAKNTRPASALEGVQSGVLLVSGDAPDGSPVVVAVQQGPKGDAPAVVATGEAAASVLKVLESQQQGYRIKLEQAVELGLVNAREFQDRREDLYLAALPVTLERFSFAAQGFFAETAALDFAGGLAGRNPRNAATFGSDATLGKLFPTGALLAVRLANQVVVDLTGDRPTATLSNLSVSLSQPFLRGGGYAVTLEPLTQAERNMVYAMRSYARFRKLFYVAIAAGGGYTNNPYGLQGLSANLGRGVGNNLTAPNVGYLPIVLQAATLANQRRNVDSLEQYLKLYQAFREGGQQSDLQVGQVEVQLLNNRNQLLGQQTAATGGGSGTSGGIRGLLDQLDQFKLQLGLPMTVGLDLDSTPLAPMQKQLARFEAVYADIRAAEEAGRQFDPAAPVDQIRARLKRLLSDAPIVKGTDFAAKLPNRWAAWEGLSPDALGKSMTKAAEERRVLLERRADRLAKQLPEDAAESARVAQLEAELDLGGFEQALRAYEARAWANLPGPARAAAQSAAFREVFNGFYQLILVARNERLDGIRRLWPKLPGAEVDGTDLLAVGIDEAYTASMQAALSRRLDLMNARGQVVDAWRQVKVQANSLQGVLDIGYNLDSATPPGGGNPVAFSGARTTHNVTFNAELPLVRRAERNNYRAALIGYQRQRRTLQAFEDNISNDVRADVRELRTIAELYRVQQRLIELAYSQVDNAQALILEPPAPNAQTSAGNAAALTNQLLQNQSQLVQAQNTLYTIWVNYLISRLALYTDTELLQIDDNGGWNDESLPTDEGPGRADPRPERLPAPRAAPAPGQ